MAKFIELKTDPELFELTLKGLRPWEIRFDDRGYAVEDLLRLRETRYTGEEMKGRVASGSTVTFKDAAGERGAVMMEIAPKPLEYTGREVFVVVTNVFRGQQYGLKVGWVILSVNPMFHCSFGEVR